MIMIFFSNLIESSLKRNAIKSYDGVIWFVGKILKYAEINFYNSKSLQDFPLILQIPLDWELKLEEEDAVIRKLQTAEQNCSLSWAKLGSEAPHN